MCLPPSNYQVARFQRQVIECAGDRVEKQRAAVERQLVYRVLNWTRGSSRCLRNPVAESEECCSSKLSCPFQNTCIKDESIEERK